jgi:hypothetical protein
MPVKVKKEKGAEDLTSIPGVGKSIAADLRRIGIRKVSDLKFQDPDRLYSESNMQVGAIQDRCLLYVFRCAVYYASTAPARRQADKLKWWNWKDSSTHF